MTLRTVLVPLFASVLLTSLGHSRALGQFENQPVRVSLAMKSFKKLAEPRLEVLPPAAKRGETVTVRLTIDLKPGVGAYTYPFFPRDTAQEARNTLSLPRPGEPASGALVFLGGTSDPPGIEEKPREDAKNGEMDQYYPHSVSWDFKAIVSPRASVGKKEVTLGSRTFVQVCKNTCIRLPADEIPPAPFEVLDGNSDKIDKDDLAAAEKLLNGGKPVEARGPAVPETVRPGQTAPAAPASEQGKKKPKPIDAYRSELEAIQAIIQKPAETSGGVSRTESLWGFVLTAAAWGLISLITPCVFPMIPITVSIFLKHAHGSLGERLKLAGVYCLTIITVLGVSAFALLKFMALLSTHPVTNILLGVIFLVLALSLFGMYELSLPNFLSRRLEAKRARGGMLGTVFGALAFTVISFTCVAPFLGGFAGISAADAGSASITVPTVREIAGGLAFATAFAAPFFILALVPGLLKALPKSGGWLDSVKVVMGFLELAAALKFLRTAEIRILPTTEYFTYDLVLGGWVAISFACGLYLLNAYRLPHDEEKPNIGVMRLLFALLFLGLGFYLFPAMFKGPDGKHQRPAGAVYAWVEAFLLPESEAWRTDLRDAVEEARKSRKPVFLDFTGVTCTNCKYNENMVFARADFQALFQQFELVQLYTDEVPESAFAADPGKEARQDEAAANRNFQQSAFADIALPLYAILVPRADGKIELLGIREGKINDPAAFAAWLREALQNARSMR
jgi:thiol:disulfide interchange protein DsbD